MQWLILSFSVVWEVDIQDDDENEEKKYDKDICAKKLRELLDDYNFCEEGMMCEVQDLKEELGSARLQAEEIRCV